MKRSSSAAVLFITAAVLLFALGGCTVPGPANRMAPVMQLRALDGEKVTVPGQDGRASMVVFWYSACEYCQAEAPRIQRIFETYGARGLAVLAVNVHDNPKIAKRFMRERGLTYPVLLDSDQRATKAYRVVGVPRIFLVDGDGYIVYEDYSVPADALIRRVLGIE
ncbi:MAG: TlpA disulfide reductase family protein [Planctomycetota bacterium]|nr:TlpA disulfide reductase family protein [Planctomycetota bacterium]